MKEQQLKCHSKIHQSDYVENEDDSFDGGDSSVDSVRYKLLCKLYVYV